MAFRSDVSVNWEVSPRIITVASPSVTITVQDLYDTLRVLEQGLDAMDDDSIVSAGGKEQLAVGEFVGITMTLQDALLAFQARVGPSFVQCNIRGGNTVAVDSAGTPFTTPIQTTAFTQVIVQQSTSPTLVTSTIVGAAAASATAVAVWNIEISTVTSTGTTGEHLGKKVLTTNKFLGLK